MMLHFFALMPFQQYFRTFWIFLEVKISINKFLQEIYNFPVLTQLEQQNRDISRVLVLDLLHSSQGLYQLSYTSWNPLVSELLKMNKLIYIQHFGIYRPEFQGL